MREDETWAVIGPRLVRSLLLPWRATRRWTAGRGSPPARRACAWPGPAPARGASEDRRAVERRPAWRVSAVDLGGVDRRGRGGPDDRRRDGGADGAARREPARRRPGAARRRRPGERRIASGRLRVR